MNKRLVTIRIAGCAWHVVYIDRVKYQRCLAASFYAPDHSKEWVENWVRNNPKLILTKTSH